jgi:hypothetical protein
MSTIVTRIMHKLRFGNEAGRVITDDRGDSVWKWNDSDIEHGGTTALLKNLDNDQLEIIEPTINVKEAKGKDFFELLDESALYAGQSPEQDVTDTDNRLANNKIRGDGGYNPYS